MTRPVFFLSDHTGITAETLGRSLLTQFGQLDFEFENMAFLDSPDKLRAACRQIDHAAKRHSTTPLIFSTLIDPAARAIVRTSTGILVDMFEVFNPLLQHALDAAPSAAHGRTHGIKDYAGYAARIRAVNFALGNDDGASISHYADADVILIGVSRCGKTPTCLYLALQYGILAANYPLTEDDMQHDGIPAPLRPWRAKLFGLCIQPERLQQLRAERHPDSRYASIEECQRETLYAKQFFERHKLPHIDTTQISIEEIAASIMQLAALRRKAS